MDILLKKFIKPSQKISDANLLHMGADKLTTIASTDRNELSNLESAGGNRKLTNFLKIYFDFAYYLCCCPFHLSADTHGWFVIKTFKPQQFLCGVIHASGIFRLITELHTAIPEELTQSPVQYFTILEKIAKVLFKAITVKRLWWNKADFGHILNFTASEKALPESDSRLQKRCMVNFICILYLIPSLVIVFGKYIIAPVSTWEKSWWRRGLVTEGRFAFFLINRTELNVIPEPEQLSALDYAAALVCGAGLIGRFLMGFYFDLCLLFAVLTLYTTSHAFATHLRGDGKTLVWTDLSSNIANGSSMSTLEKPFEKWTELYQSYKGIRTLSYLINNAYGSMITAYIAESILYHSMSMDSIFLTNDIFTQIQLCFFLCVSSIIFIFSAEICCQMDTLKLWLSHDENRRYVPLPELNVILHELHTAVVGMRGSHIFSITYSLVWNIVTTVVTYFIICVQSRVLNTRY